MSFRLRHDRLRFLERGDLLFLHLSPYLRSLMCFSRLLFHLLPSRLSSMLYQRWMRWLSLRPEQWSYLRWGERAIRLLPRNFPKQRLRCCWESIQSRHRRWLQGSFRDHQWHNQRSWLQWHPCHSWTGWMGSVERVWARYWAWVPRSVKNCNLTCCPMTLSIALKTLIFAILLWIGFLTMNLPKKKAAVAPISAPIQTDTDPSGIDTICYELVLNLLQTCL